MEALINSPNLAELAKPFYEPDSHPTIIAHNGCNMIAHIYNYTKGKVSLNDLRFQRYEILTAKSTFKLEKLPPTVGAATQHCFRVYHQLQMWFGNTLNATMWGWKESLVNNSTMLMPRYTSDTMIPDELLKKIFCTCKGNCSTNRCGCRKHGLSCTALCTNCQDTGNCSNIDEVEEDCSDSEEILNEFELPRISLDAENQEECEDSDIRDYEDAENAEEPDCTGESDEEEVSQHVNKKKRRINE